MKQTSLVSTLLMITGAVFMVAAAIGGFDDLTLVVLGFVFLAAGVAMRRRSPKA